jgi:hypothetical protein
LFSNLGKMVSIWITFDTNYYFCGLSTVKPETSVVGEGTPTTLLHLGYISIRRGKTN